MPEQQPPSLAENRRSLAAIALFAAAAIATYLVGHVDDNDSSLYVLLGESLLRDGDPFRILGPPRDFARTPFHEHPPLWFAAIAAARAVGIDPRVLGAACGVGIVALTFRLGVALVGARAALLGATLLAVTPRFVSYQPSARLDQPLVLAFTASVTLLVLARGRSWMLLAGGLAAGVGALVKGPPALGAPVAAVLVLAATGRTEELRRPVAWLLAGAGALVPPVAFLVWDRVALGGAWWTAYVDWQVLASLDGRRSDGRGHLAVLASVVRWFRPGLPFALLALAWPLVRPVAPASRRARGALLGWAALVVGAYSLGTREYAWYAFPAYPALALLGGAALEDLLARFDRGAMTRWLRRALVAGAAVLLVLLPLRVVRAVQPPCSFGPIPAEARALARAGSVVLQGKDDGSGYTGHVVLSVHCGCEIVRVQDAAAAARRPDVAGVVVERGVAAPEGAWRVVAETPRWRLLARAAEGR